MYESLEEWTEAGIGADEEGTGIGRTAQIVVILN